MFSVGKAPFVLEMEVKVGISKVLILENAFRPGMGTFIAKGFDESSTFKVKTHVAPSEDLLAELKDFAPDVVLINMDSLRRNDALTAALAVRTMVEDTTVIFISERENSALTKEGMVAALYSHSYWLNGPCRDPNTVLGEIQRAVSGGKQTDPHFLEDALTETNYLGLLSPQQHRVMRLMSTGLSNSAIGQEVGISTKAVERTIATASKLLNVEPVSADTNHRVNAAMKYLRAMSFI
jgi:DNA-binding NarL/FixJ family response regulator